MENTYVNSYWRTFYEKRPFGTRCNVCSDCVLYGGGS